MEKENTVEKETTEAPSGDGFSFDINDIDVTSESGRALIDAIVGKMVDAKAPVKERAQVDVNPKADAEKAQPAVKVDNEWHWRKRVVRYFNAATTLSNPGRHTDNERQEAAHMLAEVQRVTRSLQSFQLGEEDKEADDIISGSGLSKRVQSRLHDTLSGPAGEFLLPKPFLAEVFSIIEAYGEVRRLFRVIPMTSKDLDLKNVSTKPTTAWTGEGVLFTESDLVLSEQKLTTNKLAAITSWSTELNEDQAIALLPIYMREIGEGLAQDEDEAGLIGDGTSTYGGFTGVINYGSVNTTTMGTGDLAIADIAEGDLRSMLKSLTVASRRGGRWLLHYDVWDHIKTLENTAGFRLVQTPDITGAGPMSLLGYPVEILEAMPNPTGDNASTLLMAFCDPSRILMGQRRGLSVDTSTEAVLSNSSGVVTFNAYQQDGQLLRISERIGFQCPTANQAAIAVLSTAAS